MTDLGQLGRAQYVLVTSYRKDGRAVPTAVWAAPDGDGLVFWTVTGSGKVKRIRRSGEVTVAPCTVRGEPTGPAVPGRARLLDAAGTERVRSLLKKKYGFLGWLTVTGSKVRRGPGGTVGVHVTPA